MQLRLEFENEMQDWIKANGRPTWDEEWEVYKEEPWQLAWVAYLKCWKKHVMNKGRTDLIDRLGGYEAASKIRVAFDATHYCISRKSMMKVFSPSKEMQETTDYLLENCGYTETKLADDDLVTQAEIDSALEQYRLKHNIQ